MKQSPWKPETVETEFVTVSPEEFDRILDEWAEMVYRHLCQLHEKEILVPGTSSPNTAESTGTGE